MMENETTDGKRAAVKLFILKKKRKGIDLSKYAGKVKFDIDPVEYQRQIRDEWR
jgi:hypothetical protein